ncbi:MAG: hypothetical protein HY731_04090 [Candidatus Tectomicrobia bacterium]|nr:hypothetical protein [Candidatus Tectomicrobia bacterium]
MKQTTAEAIYNQMVKTLPPSERLKLATLILNDIPPRAVVDYSEEWTEEDMRDLMIYSLRYAAKSFGEEEEEGDDAGR